MSIAQSGDRPSMVARRELGRAAAGPMKIAFVGVGRMGRELLTHLIAAGYDVTVWNRTPSAADFAVAQGASRATTIADATADADVVVSVLFGPDTVRDVLVNNRARFGPRALWIDVTTVAPTDAREFQEWADSRGIRYVHSPVIGSLAPARAGTLGVILGGARSAVDDALAITNLWADPDRVRRFDSPAKAATAKLVANLAVAVSMQGLVEALRLGHAGGLTTEEVVIGLDKTPLAVIAAIKSTTIRAMSFADTQFSANALAKDTRLMLDTSPVELAAVRVAHLSLADAQTEGLGEQDFSVVAHKDC